MSAPSQSKERILPRTPIRCKSRKKLKNDRLVYDGATMGIHIHQWDSTFHIKKENFAGAVKALKDLSERTDLMDNGKFTWVSINYVELTDLQKILECWRWSSTLDEDGDIADICFEGESYGDDEILFEALAPFVEDGSCIQMSDDYLDQWRWKFVNGELVIQTSKVVWEGEESPL
jgi:hypothetical protein